MIEQGFKCVMVIDYTLPVGLIANTAAVMGVSLGKLFPQTVGCDVTDGDGNVHRGIVEMPVPVLKGDADGLYALREKLRQPEYGDLETVDFTDTAQSCKAYDDFTSKLAHTPADRLRYLGLAVCGDKKLVNRLTGSMPLLR